MAHHRRSTITQPKSGFVMLVVFAALVISLGAISLVVGNRTQNTDPLTRASNDLIDIYLNPEQITTSAVSNFNTDVILNANNHPLNRASVIITYDPAVIGFSNLEVAEPFTLTALDSSNPGVVAFGISAECTTNDCYPTTATYVASLAWQATAPGVTTIVVEESSQAGSADSTSNLVGNVSATTVTVTP